MQVNWLIEGKRLNCNFIGWELWKSKIHAVFVIFHWISTCVFLHLTSGVMWLGPAVLCDVAPSPWDWVTCSGQNRPGWDNILRDGLCTAWSAEITRRSDTACAANKAPAGRHAVFLRKRFTQCNIAFYTSWGFHTFAFVTDTTFTALLNVPFLWPAHCMARWPHANAQKTVNVLPFVTFWKNSRAEKSPPRFSAQNHRCGRSFSLQVFQFVDRWPEGNSRKRKRFLPEKVRHLREYRATGINTGVYIFLSNSHHSESNYSQSSPNKKFRWVSGKEKEVW